MFRRSFFSRQLRFTVAIPVILNMLLLNVAPVSASTSLLNFSINAYNVPQLIAAPPSSAAMAALASRPSPPSLPANAVAVRATRSFALSPLVAPPNPKPPIAVKSLLNINGAAILLMQMKSYPVDPAQAPRDPSAINLFGATGAALPTRAIRTSRNRLVTVNQPRLTPSLTDTVNRIAHKFDRRRFALTPNLGSFTANAANPELSGYKPWYRYTDGVIPGIGSYAANVASGNFMVSASDGAFSAPGLELGVTRTYNSILGIEEAAGNLPHSLFGTGWTSSVDAHLVMNTGNANGQGITYFDGSGARYDYMPDGSGNWVAPAGMHSLLTWDNNIGYFITAPDGSVSYFFGPSVGTKYPQYAGLAGRLFKFFHRNSNNSIQFYWNTGGNTGCQYSTSCDYSTFNNMTSLQLVHSNGLSMFLTFSAGQGGPLVSSTQWPDGTQQVSYQYDSTDDLLAVNHPGDNASASIPEDYFYGNGEGYSSTHGAAYAPLGAMWGAESPRLNLAIANNANPDGYAANIYYGANYAGNVYAVSGIVEAGNYNPVFGSSPFVDGVNSGPLQSNFPGGINYQAPVVQRTVNITYPTDANNTWTYVTDTDGHQTGYHIDSQFRSDDTALFTENGYLSSNVQYDGDNEVVKSWDPRGNETDFAYDQTLRNGRPTGNLLAVAGPAITAYNGSSSLGQFRPTSYISYDSHNNVTASCDPVWSNAHGYNWASTPTSSPCAAGAGVSSATYTSTNNDSYGELATTTSMAGYTTTLTYSSSAQGSNVDRGLVTQATGAAITEADGNSGATTFSATYDGYGNLYSYSNSGRGGTTSYAYDSDDRLLKSTDPDGVSTSQTYFPNGLVASKTSPAEAAAGVSTTRTYDADGDLVSSTGHLGGVASTTQWFYDGIDRLIEVLEPHGSGDVGHWITRSIYDLSQNGSAGSESFSIGSSSVTLKGHGGLVQTSGGGAVAAWSYDMIGRPTTKYNVQPGTSTIQSKTFAYDGSGSGSSGYYGLEQSETDSLGETKTFTYDAAGRVVGLAYANTNGTTPNLGYSLDPDGRVAQLTSSAFGTEYRTYDSGGRLATRQEASGGGVSFPATYSYSYYADGHPQAMGFSVPGDSNTYSHAFSYSWTPDGIVRSASMNALAPTTLSWSLTAAGRTTTVHNDTGVSENSGPSLETRSYDLSGSEHAATGESTELKLPDQDINSFAYDEEGELNRVTFPDGTSSNIAYTVRGEISDQYYSSVNTSDSTFDYAHHDFQNNNGIMQYVPASVAYDTAPVYDQNNATLLTDSSTSRIQQLNGTTKKIATSTSSYSYDVAGREVNHAAHSTPADAGPNCGTSPPLDNNSSTTVRTYDFDDHIVSQALSASSGTYDTATCSNETTTTNSSNTPIGWGPNGHPILINGYTLHWDGDTLLYISDQFGVEDLLFGRSGEVIPKDSNYAGFTYYARDWSGAILMRETSLGHSSLQIADGAASGYDTDGSSTANFAQASPIFPYLKADGIEIVSPTSNNGLYGNSQQDNLTINGVRSYDAGLAGWTTPDHFPGSLDSPQSLQHYSYANNNTVAFQDCSGYDPSSSGGGSAGGSGDTPPFLKTIADTKSWYYDPFSRDNEAGFGFGSGGGQVAQLIGGSGFNSGLSKCTTGENQYVTVSVSFSFLVAAGYSFTVSNNAWFSGPSVGFGAPTGPGFSIMTGTVMPYAGNTANDVLSGKSEVPEIGFGVGGQAPYNDSGLALGGGVTTPGATVMTSYMNSTPNALPFGIAQCSQ